jgi:8-oxo-dGTP pyrophosphatase MutT (NUDIX family)
MMSSSAISIRQKLGRVLSPFYLTYCQLSRGMTLGVRAAVIDGQGRVFLVKHTYVPGWHLPGGGVEVHQSAEEALARELDEEGHIRLDQPGELRGLYYNKEASRRDHVAFFVVRHFTQQRPRRPDREIAEASFFAANALPAGTTQGTRRRLDELAGRRVPDGFW